MRFRPSGRRQRDYRTRRLQRAPTQVRVFPANIRKILISRLFDYQPTEPSSRPHGSCFFGHHRLISCLLPFFCLSSFLLPLKSSGPLSSSHFARLCSSSLHVSSETGNVGNMLILADGEDFYGIQVRKEKGGEAISKGPVHTLFKCQMYEMKPFIILYQI